MARPCRPAAPAMRLPDEAAEQLVAPGPVGPGLADRHIAALAREVLARPDADDARLVLADALLADGDPRGELIALQLSAATGDRRLDRIDQLLREHGKAWLGALRDITYRARFERGFVARLELDGRWTASELDWARHAADPALATVEDLIPGRSVGPVYARFMASRAMTGLRRVEVFDRPTLDALRATPANLIHVAYPRWKLGRYVRELADHVLPACLRFAQLRSFAVHLDGAASVMASALFDRLTQLTVAGSLAAGLALWSRLPRTMSLTVSRSALLESCVTTRVGWAGALQVARDGDLVVARGAGDWLIGELVEHFAALPGELHRLEIEGAGAHAAALAAAARRRGIELVLLPPARRTGFVAGDER